MRGRSVPGVSTAALRQRAIQQKIKMRAAPRATQNAAGASGVWTSLGPLPLPSDASGMGLQDYGWVTGRATAVAIDPNDPSGNTVFAGGAYGGVWKSSNAGAASPSPVSVNWTPLTDNQATLAIGAIADPAAALDSRSDQERGPRRNRRNQQLGGLLLRLGNSALARRRRNLGSDHFAGLNRHSFLCRMGFSQIAFSSANPNLVVAAAASASQGIIEGPGKSFGSNRGLYYSTDAGVTWQAAIINDPSATISPASATAVVYNAAAATFYAAIRFHGFYSSPDGITWTRLASQPGSGLTTASVRRKRFFRVPARSIVAKSLSYPTAPAHRTSAKCTPGMWTLTTPTRASGKASTAAQPGFRSTTPASPTAAIFSAGAALRREVTTSRSPPFPTAPRLISMPEPKISTSAPSRMRSPPATEPATTLS